VRPSGEDEDLSQVRLAELLALLSLGTDLGLGHPMEHMIRECLVALRLAERVGLDEAQRGVVYYAGLLAWVGCHTDAYEQAKWFGDDIGMKHDFITKGPFKTLGRARMSIAFFRFGLRDLGDMLMNHYLATDELAARLSLGQDVRDSLHQTFERWDGKGLFKFKREEIPLTQRIVTLADVVVAFHRLHGVEGAIAVARERSGKQLDPELVERFCRNAHELLCDDELSNVWESTLAAEPVLAPRLNEEALDRALEAIGDFADLKSPWMIGHSRAVAELARDAGVDYGMPASEIALVRRAALVHDLGHLGVPNSIWDKRGAISPVERERVRMHPYLAERMLSHSASLAPIAAIAAQHHERLDGSGYPGGLSGDAILPASRILAAADVYNALLQRRPHRPERSADEAAHEVRSMVAAGRLEGRAVDAVLRAAGHRVRRRREWPSGLTAREVEVLRLVALGMSNKEIAAELSITPKTAGSHVEHIYAKIGVTNRARASLFAMKYGLIDKDVG